MHARVLLVVSLLLLIAPGAASGFAGDLDTAFDGDGLAEIAVGAGDAFPSTILTRGTGEVVIAGQGAATAQQSVAIAQLKANGTPDTGFGGGSGYVETALPSGSSAQVTGAALQSDGMVVVAGTATTTMNVRELFVARYTTAGALDATFGTGGINELPLISNAQVDAGDVAITSDGKVVVAFSETQPGDVPRMGAARFTGAGVLDTSYVANGYQLVANPDTTHGTTGAHLALQSGDRLVLGGTANNDFRLARLDADGGLDTGFGSAGYVDVDFGGTTDELTSLAVRNDLDVVAGGTAGTTTWALARLVPDGALDTTWDTDGKRTHQEGNTESRLNALAVRGGRTYSAGYSKQDALAPRATLARYGNTGAIDIDRVQVFHSNHQAYFHSVTTPSAHVLVAASVEGSDNRFRFGVAAFQYGSGEDAPPTNNAPPVINGLATVGSTLTSTTGDWTPSTGLTFTYDWQVCHVAGSTCASYDVVPNVSGPQYVVQASDAGKLIRVRVSAHGDGDTATVRSNPVGPVTAANTSAIDLVKPAVGAQLALPPDTVRIEGTADTGGAATVHVALTSGATTVSQADIARDATTGAFATDYAVPHADAAYHLVVTHDTASDSADFTTDATAPVVTVSSPAAGASLAGVRVSFAGTLGTAGGDQASLTATLSGTSSATLTPVISGGSWSASRDLGEGSYTLTVKQSDAAGHQTTVTRAFTVAYSAPVLTPARSPELVGPRTINQDLSAETLNFSGTQPVSLAWKWERCTGYLVCSLLPDTGPTHHTTDADADLYLRLTATATNAKGATTVEFKVAGPISRAGLGPKFVSNPTLEGTPTVGSTLHTNGGEWANNPTKEIQWLRCKDQSGTLSCAKIDGATGRDYTVTTADQGYRLRVAAQATDTNGTSPVALSELSDMVPSACQSSITFGALTATGCFQQKGLVWTAEGTVHVNGLTLQPSSGSAKIIIDPLNLRVASSGKAKVIAGPVNLPGGLRFGPVTLYEGQFDLVFQLNPNLNPINELKKLQGIGIPLTGGAPTLALPKFPDVPNLAAGLDHLPRIGLPDFSGLTGNALKQLHGAIPSWNLPAVTFPKSIIPDFKLPEIGMSIPQLPGIGGFNLDGSVTAKPIDGGMEIVASLKIPGFKYGIQLPDLTANATFDVLANGSGVFKGLSAVLGTMQLGPLSVENFNLNYSPGENSWGGGAQVLLNPIHQGFGGQFGFKDGALTNASLDVLTDIPVAATGLFLNQLGLGYSQPPPTISGKAGISVGPTLPIINVPAVQLLGSASYAFASGSTPGVLKFTGALNLAKNKISDGFVERKDTGDIRFEGNLNLTVPNSGSPGLGLSGRLGGFFTGPYWQVDGKLDLNGAIFGQGATGHLEGRGSEVGLAGCGTAKLQVGPFSWDGKAGGGFKWATRQWEWFGGVCGLDDYQSAGARRAGSPLQAGALTVSVPKDLEVRAFSVTGADAPPKIEIDAPDGTKATSPPDGYNASVIGRYYVIADPSTNTTNVLAYKPPAGTWTIRQQPGSTAIAGVRDADPLPPVAVSGRVTGHGHARKLVYSVTPQAGMAVRFTEESDDANAVIGTAKGKSGTLPFRPHYGPAGERRIMAHVTQDGFPREDDVLTTYTAPAPAKAGRVRGLHVRRRKAKLVVGWKRARGASGYRVVVTANGGTRSFDLTASHLGFTLPGVFASRRAAVSVRALDAVHQPGKASVRTLRSAKRLKAGRRRGGKRLK